MLVSRQKQDSGGVHRPENRIAGHFKKYHQLWLLALPGIILTLMFAYIPMSGLVIIFKDYNYRDGIFGSPWVGFKNFEFFFANFSKAWRATRNTILLNLCYTVFGTAMAVMLAVMFNEIRHKKYLKATQSLSIMPYFISWVVVGVFVFSIFNYETGLINTMISSLGGEKINFYMMPMAWPIIICAFNTWKWTGYNSVIYIAAVTGVDGEINEAAEIDGATIFQRIRYITLPSIRPTLVTMVLLQIGRILRGDFEMFYQIVGNNGQLFNATDVIDTYVFRSLITNPDIGMTAAATFYQSVLCFAIIMIVNTVVKKIDEDYALF